MQHLITIVGLGPSGIDSMSVAALKAVRSAERLIVRTERHPAAAELRSEGTEFESLDRFYETAHNFDSLYDQIATYVIEPSRAGDVTYAVPGHPLVAEESVRRLLSRAAEQDVSVQLIGSQSFIEAALESLDLSLADGIQLVDALALDHVKPRADLPAIVYQIYDRQIASQAKLAIMQIYPDEFEVKVIRGGERPVIESVPLRNLDRVTIDHLTAIYVPPLPADKRKKTFDDLVLVMARLRGEGGCPWDREQDHQTLKRYLVEECYEVIEAIEDEDMDSLVEELGDLLLQVVFHAQLEAETGLFTIEDVITLIVDKLIRRHPHVFGDLSVADAEEVLRNWEKIKKAEKGEGWRDSVLDGVPSGLPALMRALEISNRVVKVGFEWEKFEDVLAKMDEETAELHHAIATGDKESIQSEIGDLLFTIVNLARWQKIDPEDALRSMLQRFSARFRHIESAARSQGRRLEEMTLAEMDSLWDEAKAAARG